MNCKPIYLTFTAGTLCLEPRQCRGPSPEVLERWGEHERKRDEQIEKAKPWKETLGKAFPGESEDVVKLFLLTTYKHYLPDSGKLAKAGEGKCGEGLLQGLGQGQGRLREGGPGPGQSGHFRIRADEFRLGSRQHCQGTGP